MAPLMLVVARVSSIISVEAPNERGCSFFPGETQGCLCSPCRCCSCCWCCCCYSSCCCCSGCHFCYSSCYRAASQPRHPCRLLVLATAIASPKCSVAPSRPVSPCRLGAASSSIVSHVFDDAAVLETSDSTNAACVRGVQLLIRTLFDYEDARSMPPRLAPMPYCCGCTAGGEFEEGKEVASASAGTFPPAGLRQRLGRDEAKGRRRCFGKSSFRAFGSYPGLVDP